MTTLQDAGTTRETAEVFTWTFPGAPLSIELDSKVISQLARVTSRDGGGLLSGRRSSPGTLEITICEPVAGENEGLYGAIVQAKRRRDQETAGEQPIVVGYYRTHTGDRLAIGALDVDVVEKAFHRNHDIVLLIKRHANGPAMAGFFFSAGLHLPFDVSFLEFPLDPSALPTRRIVRKKATAEVKQEEIIPAITPVPVRAAEEPEAGSRMRRWSRSFLVRAGLITVLNVVGVVIAVLGHAYLQEPARSGENTRAPNQINSSVSGVSPVAPDLPSELPADTGESARARAQPIVNAANTNNSEVGPGTQLTSNSRNTAQTNPDATEPAMIEPPTDLEALVQSHPGDRALVDGMDPRLAASMTAPLHALKPPGAATATAAAVRLVGEASERQSTQQLPGPNALNQPAHPVQNDGTRVASPAPVPVPPSKVVPSAEKPLQRGPAEARAPLSAQPGTDSPVTPLGTAAPTEPQPIHHPQPTVPLNVLNSLSREVVVSVRLQIDQSGNVVHATSQSPPGALGDYLAARALAAARFWKFTPAKIGKSNAASEKVLEFRFAPPARSR